MKSPYLTAQEAAEYLRYTTVAGFRDAARRKAVPSLLRGQAHLYLETDLQTAWAKPAKANLREAKRRVG